MEILTQEGLAFLSRWAHIISGITWIGLLYYFNLAQVPAFAQFEAAPRTEAIRKLVPRVLWWFRWAALATFIFGVLILGFQERFVGQPGFSDYWASPSGTSIYTGALLGVVMLVNVWAVIWPNQKIVIASAEAVAAGGQADPNAAAAGRKALVISRTNVLFSATMLFFMAATSHFVATSAAFLQLEASARTAYWIYIVAIVAVIEANGLGLIGGVGPSPLRKPLETVPMVIGSSILLAVIVYLVGWEVILAG